MEEGSINHEEDMPCASQISSPQYIYDSFIPSPAPESVKSYTGDDQLSEARAPKRQRGVREGESWIEVERRGRRVAVRRSKRDNSALDPEKEICITSPEVLPKQFALAKQLNAHGIVNINRIRYINPYKIYVEMDSENAAQNLLSCDALKELGWRCQKRYEVSTSYGIIRNFEIELEEKDLLEVIKCSFCDIVGAKRLQRRSKDGTEWETSETIRLGFKGSSLPPFVEIYGVKVRVEAYIFPVTQCSKCWRYGHSAKLCPSKRIICPKCGQNHSNCDTTSYKCVNCGGHHMTLDRICPKYKKERRLRELMSEFNISYRKAMDVYIPPEHSPSNDKHPPLPTTNQHPPTQESERESIRNNKNQPLFSEVVKKKTPCKPSTSTQEEKNKRKIQMKKDKDTWEDIFSDTDRSVVDDDMNENNPVEERSKRKRGEYNMSFTRLFNELKKIILSRSVEDFTTKIKRAVWLLIDWIISNIGRVVTFDLPSFSSLFRDG